MSKTNKMTSRKFWLVVGILLLSTALRIFNVLNPDQWVDIVKWILMVYVAGNVVQDVGYNWSQSYYNNHKETTTDGADG